MGFLKLLLLENFKSWRGRQSIGPFMRFNCIIGPNGSGKSNIMDALSFVMGERTANLRVKSVQELIHGAHIGKPFSSTASVKIVYCEENGEEKTFSRIIRGSCSEFLFNDKAVSRSVYTAELEKIGIIVKARNCMVFQAERYQMLLEELKENRIQLQLFRLYHNEKKIDFLNNKLDEKNMDVNTKEDSLSSAEDTFKAKKKVLGMLNRDQQHMEKEMKTLEASLNQKRPQYIKAKENTSHQIKKVDLAKKSLKDNEKHLAKQEQNIKELDTELTDVERSWRAYEKKVEEEMLQRRADVELEASQLDRYKELKELARKKVATLTQQLEKLQWEQKADLERMTFDERKQKEIEESIKQVVEQIEDHKKRIEKLEEYTKSCTELLAEKKQQEKVLTDEMENSRVQIAQVNEELNKIVGELQNARIDYHEGRRQQMRAEILESLKRLYPDSVFGRLLDLCHPIHKKYQLAVTKVFGKYMSAIVVATEKIARDCIRFLKEERAEPETFLALDYLDTVSLDGTLFLKSGVISGGSSDLKFKARYWDEKEMKEMKERRDRLVNELKELMKIKRKETDLKQLQAQCQGIQTRLKYSQSELENIKKKHLANFYKEKSKLESELVNIKSQYAMLNEGLLQRTEKIEEFQKKMNEVEDAVFQDFCEEIGVENIRVFEQERVKLQEETDRKRLEFENQKTRLSIQLEYSRGQLQKLVNKIHMLKETIRKDEAEIVRLKKAEEECLLMVNEIMEEQQHLKDKLITLKTEVTKAQNEVEESRKKLLTLNREMGKLQKEAISIETSLEQKRLERHNMLLECKVQDLRISLLLGSLDEISEVELGTEAESTEATADIYERERAIQIDYSSLTDDLTDLQSDKEIEAHLTRLQQQIVSKENVLFKTAAPNLRALEKLQTAKDKFQESVDAFETSRREARICRQEFEQMKKRRYERFSQCFEHVSVAIDQIYKKLCRNSCAQAFLSPENPEEPYLEGISYNCVAPGKRFMPMDNLSGGEKSVAALALVFAIHSFRPAPFFILDEVDAALDNTNIGKVSSFIKEQAQEQCQMIVISLKEEFYSRADALIGVCPEQDDYMFSQVLTLDLTVYPDIDDSERKEKHRYSSTLE
ncbi:structural maintenance of chromosomes protein 1B isoform X5 [Chrysemys picta bellii]|uniref:structural maintenance of chromosomes protein 1B isoform X5 n=1 Tax=Chrysemys picta bellii TaxID=8478 RepID=UPI0032B24E32